MKITIKTVLKLSLAILILLSFYILGRSFGPGSYPYAEKYVLEYPVDKVVLAVKSFKKKHPQYIVPEVFIEGKNIGTMEDDNDEDWYFAYFYYEDKNQIVFTYIRSTFEKGKTTFAFHALGYGLDLSPAKKTINQSWVPFSDYAEKKEFEERILKPIEKELESQ